MNLLKKDRFLKEWLRLSMLASTSQSPGATLMNNNETNTTTQANDTIERSIAEARELRTEYLAEIMSGAAASFGVMFSIKDVFSKVAKTKFSH
jgi:hypothetical protein|tara:strand:+ start:383 stop:661 length:279 start_codon:yes stop_codon:yes gene_type:complete